MSARAASRSVQISRVCVWTLKRSLGWLLCANRRRVATSDRLFQRSRSHAENSAITSDTDRLRTVEIHSAWPCARDPNADHVGRFLPRSATRARRVVSPATLLAGSPMRAHTSSIARHCSELARWGCARTRTSPSSVGGRGVEHSTLGPQCADRWPTVVSPSCCASNIPGTTANARGQADNREGHCGR
jgi:hypothetical protein